MLIIIYQPASCYPKFYPILPFVSITHRFLSPQPEVAPGILSAYTLLQLTAYLSALAPDTGFLYPESSPHARNSKNRTELILFFSHIIYKKRRNLPCQIIITRIPTAIAAGASIRFCLVTAGAAMTDATTAGTDMTIVAIPAETDATTAGTDTMTAGTDTTIAETGVTTAGIVSIIGLGGNMRLPH